jgi:hypothetical protein
VVLVVLVRAARTRAAHAEPGEHQRHHPGEHHVDADQPRRRDPVVPRAVHGVASQTRSPTLRDGEFLSRAATDCEHTTAPRGNETPRTGAIRTPVSILGVVRGGGAQVTTDLLAEWTDPDTAMEAVGNGLGVFDHVPSAVRLLHDDSRLRDALYEVLLVLVEGGALETRACADGRFAFRWRAEIDLTPATGTNGSAPIASPPAPMSPPGLPPAAEAPPEFGPVEVEARAAAAAPPEEHSVDEAPSVAAPARKARGLIWRRLAVQTAPLLLPTLSCVIVLLAFVWLDQSVALVIAGVMAIVGVVGVVRRVQLAAFWTMGLVIAGLLLRFS